MSFSCSACITAHFIQPLNILPRPVTKPDLQMLKKTLNPCGIFGVKKGQSGDECAICIREPAMAVCLNNVSRPQTEPYLRLPRVALRPLRSGCPHRASRTCFSFRSLCPVHRLLHRLPLPDRCLHALLYFPSAPEDPRDPVPPLAREVPPRWGFCLRLLPPLSCFVPLTVRFLLTPGLFLLRSLHPWLHYRLHFLPSFLTTQHLLHFVMTSLAF
ncbi:hypothetical protein ECTW10119_2614 [Escherichia coli TW10119]|nr:hypothetical protein ECTW10119_2614 [Escherichia coli TW10119]